MENLSVSTDYTRYHDKCTLRPYGDIRTLSLTGQSLWIPLPSTAAVVLALPFYTRCCSMSPIFLALPQFSCLTTLASGWEGPRATSYSAIRTSIPSPVFILTHIKISLSLECGCTTTYVVGVLTFIRMSSLFIVRHINSPGVRTAKRRCRDNTAGRSVHICGDAQQGFKQGSYSPGRKMSSGKDLYYVVS
jgi:hypothetical protein